MYDILCELELMYSSDNYDNWHFWNAIDNLTYKQLKPWLERLVRTPEFGGSNWFSVCSILNDYERYGWSKKQQRFCVLQIIQHWDDLCVAHGHGL